MIKIVIDTLGADMGLAPVVEGVAKAFQEGQEFFPVLVGPAEEIKAILDQRREAADKEINDAKAAREDAMNIKATYEENMRQSKAKADQLLINAQQTANARSEEIIHDAQRTAVAIKQKAEAEIAQEKKKVLNEAKNEISGLAMAIAGKVVGRELTADDQSKLIDSFIDELGDQV